MKYHLRSSSEDRNKGTASSSSIQVEPSENSNKPTASSSSSRVESSTPSIQLRRSSRKRARKEPPPQSDSSSPEARQKSSPEARQKSSPGARQKSSPEACQKDDDLEEPKTQTKKVRINENSNTVHTFSSYSSTPAANNEEADNFKAVDEAESTEEAFYSSAPASNNEADNKAVDEADFTDEAAPAANNEADNNNKAVDEADSSTEESFCSSSACASNNEADDKAVEEADSTKEATPAANIEAGNKAVDEADSVKEAAPATNNEAEDKAINEAASTKEATPATNNEADNNKAVDEADSNEEASTLEDTVDSTKGASTLEDGSTDNATSEASTTNNEAYTEELDWKDYEKDWHIIPILVGEHRGAKLGMVLAAIPFTEGGKTKHCHVHRFTTTDSLAQKLGVQRGDWICETVRSNPVLLKHASVLEWWRGSPLFFFLLRTRHLSMSQQANSNSASPTISRRLFMGSAATSTSTPITAQQDCSVPTPAAGSAATGTRSTPIMAHEDSVPTPTTGQRRRTNLFTGNLLPGIVGMLSSPGEQNGRNQEFAAARQRRHESYKQLRGGTRPEKFAHLQGRTMRRARTNFVDKLFRFAHATHPKPLDKKGTSTAAWPTMSAAGIIFDQIRPSNKNGGAYPERKQRTWPIERCSENTRPKEMILVAVRDREFLEEFKAKMRSIVTSDFTSTDELEIVFAFDPESVNLEIDGEARTQLEGSAGIHRLYQEEARHAATPKENRGTASSSSPSNESSLTSHEVPYVDDLDGIVF
jgi:hypothetical protein